MRRLAIVAMVQLAVFLMFLIFSLIPGLLSGGSLEFAFGVGIIVALVTAVAVVTDAIYLHFRHMKDN